MATTCFFNGTDTWQVEDYQTPSGNMDWVNTNPYEFAHIEQTVHSESLNHIPDEARDEGVEPIQGNPDGARYLISYAFKDDKDPVIFLENKKDMMQMLKRLMEDEKVDHKTIIISRIRE